MCGICGLALNPGREVELKRLQAMTRAMAHRGPDGEGFYLEGNLGLGHRRLSIIDLESGDQPMQNEDGRVQVVFNGEIYNYRELTAELKSRGHTFQTRSDTETLVHLYEEMGMEMLHRLRGMFAFALWDRDQKTLFLVRDRFGIKPLYYHQAQGCLYFASEVQPLLEAGCPLEVNPAGVHHYLVHRFAHQDETIFKGIHRLPEGTMLSWQGGRARLERYYPNPRVQGRDDGRDFQGLFESELRRAVELRMIADVPVGAYLSGGVDSSVVVSEMARLTTRPVQTFCVDFARGLTERDLAQGTARALGCRHQGVLCDVEEILELPRVVRALEEPVGDAVTVPVFFLSRATRDAGIKTVLTGDGADETLGGYQFLRAAMAAMTWGRRLPGFIFSPLGQKLVPLLPAPWLLRLSDIPFHAPREVKLRLQKLLALTPRRDLTGIYDLLLSMYLPQELKEVYNDSFYRRTRHLALESFAGQPRGESDQDRVLSLQYRKWLPANINLKQDKLCMAHSVENRVPFLDHKLVELVTSFPCRVKMKGKGNKLLLRRLAAKHRLHPDIVSGRKVPFYLPLEHYLQDQRLWDLIQENTDPQRVRRRGILNPGYIEHLKDRARARDFMAAKKLMALVILELWHRIYLDGEKVASPADEVQPLPPERVLLRRARP